MYLLVFIREFTLFVSSCIMFWFWHVYILVHIYCEHRIEIYLCNTYYILCFVQKSLFPFCFRNHDIYPHWTYGSNPDSGGCLADIDLPRTLLYLGPGVMKTHLSFSTPVGIKGLVESDSPLIQYPLAFFGKSMLAWSSAPLGNRIPKLVIPCLM